MAQTHKTHLQKWASQFFKIIIKTFLYKNPHKWGKKNIGIEMNLLQCVSTAIALCPPKGPAPHFGIHWITLRALNVIRSRIILNITLYMFSGAS